MSWTQRFQDGFTDTDFTDLASHTPSHTGGGSGSWVAAGGGTLRIATGGATVGSAGGANYGITPTLQAQQAVQLKWISVADAFALFLRATATGSSEQQLDGYRVTFDGSGGAGNGVVSLTACDNGAPRTSFAQQTGLTFSNGDVVRVEVDENFTIDVLVNGVSVGGPFPYDGAADAPTFATGGPQLYIDHSVDGFGDDFAAFDDAGGGGALSWLPATAIAQGPTTAFVPTGMTPPE